MQAISGVGLGVTLSALFFPFLPPHERACSHPRAPDFQFSGFPALCFSTGENFVEEREDKTLRTVLISFSRGLVSQNKIKLM